MSKALRTPAMPTPRRTGRALWLRVHRWLALGIGWVLVMSGITGALLVVVDPLDEWAHARWFQVPVADDGATAPAVPLQDVRERLDSEFGRRADLTFRPPRERGESLQVLVRGAWRGTVYLDPGDGTELGRRGENEGFRNLLFELHSSLWLQEAGKAVLAIVALIYGLLLVTGVVLWWPRRWPPSWRIELGLGRSRALFDLHRTGGVIVAAVVLVSVTTGAYMAWRPLGGWVNRVAGAQAVAPPEVGESGVGESGVGEPRVGTAQPLDILVARARAEFAGAPVGYVQVPADPGKPVRVRLRLADDPHPNGLTSVWLHPRTGQVLAARRWNELDPGAGAVAVIYPLHTGVLGGPWLEAVIAVAGLCLGGLGITGLWLWWRRRARGRAR